MATVEYPLASWGNDMIERENLRSMSDKNSVADCYTAIRCDDHILCKIDIIPQDQTPPSHDPHPWIKDDTFANTRPGHP